MSARAHRIASFFWHAHLRVVRDAGVVVAWMTRSVQRARGRGGVGTEAVDRCRLHGALTPTHPHIHSALYTSQPRSLSNPISRTGSHRAPRRTPAMASCQMARRAKGGRGLTAEWCAQHARQKIRQKSTIACVSQLGPPLVAAGGGVTRENTDRSAWNLNQHGTLVNFTGRFRALPNGSAGPWAWLRPCKLTRL